MTGERTPSWAHGIRPIPPDKPLSNPVGGLGADDWRRLHDWKWRCWEADENPALVEWAMPEELARYRFIRWLIEQGTFNEQK